MGTQGELEVGGTGCGASRRCLAAHVVAGEGTARGLVAVSAFERALKDVWLLGCCKAYPGTN